MNSNQLFTPENQADLPMARRPNPANLPIEFVRAKKNSGAAFTLACDTSGLDDKEIYSTLGIDAGYFSKIKGGMATLQADKIREFCEIVGNTIYSEWLAYQVGCTLVQIESETQRQLRHAQEKRMEAEKENAILRSVIAGRSA